MRALAYPQNVVVFPSSRVQASVNIPFSQDGNVVNLDDHRMMAEIKRVTGLTDKDFDHMKATRTLLEDTMAEIMDNPKTNDALPMKEEKHLYMDSIIPEELADLMGNHEIDEVRVILDKELEALVELLGEPRVHKLAAMITNLSQTISDTSHAEGLAGGYLISDPEMDF